MSKYLSVGYEIAKSRFLRKNVPILVTLCVTSRCNLKCIYCYAENITSEKKEFTTEQILTLIDELNTMGTKHISLNGGEALLRNDIDEILDRINKYGMVSHISSNGVVIPKKISALKKVDSLAISIDGAKESNDKNRGEGVYDRIIEAFDVLKKNKIKFHTHTVLTRNNRNAVREVLELAKKYGFKAQFSILRIEDSPDKKIGLEDEELKNIAREIIDFKKKGEPVFYSTKPYNNFLEWPMSYKEQTISGKLPDKFCPMKCYIKRFSCHIEPDGLVYPCIVLVNKVKAENFLEVGIEKAWENLAGKDCRACYNICLNEINLLFGLRPRALWNAMGIVLKRLMNRSSE